MSFEIGGFLGSPDLLVPALGRSSNFAHSDGPIGGGLKRTRLVPLRSAFDSLGFRLNPPIRTLARYSISQNHRDATQVTTPDTEKT